MEYKNIYIINKISNKKEKCCLLISESEPWCIELICSSFEKEKYDGDDLFEALIKMRKKLEEKDMLILCNGAKKNISPSGMSRSMGGGRKASYIEIGSPVKSGNLVDIFDYAERNKVVSVLKQKQYFMEWVESLKRL